MSRPSPTDHPTTTSPLATGTYHAHPYASGTSATSSRPSTASAPRTGIHGSHSGVPLEHPLAELDAPAGSRRHSTESTAQTPSRAFGVHSILNPQAEPEERDSASVRLPPPPAMSVTTQTLLSAPSESPRSRKRTDPRSPVRDHDLPPSTRIGRRVLTPKSPAVRAASLGARRNPSFHSTIQPLQHIPGSTGRTYTVEPGLYRSSDIPPLPSLAIATGSNLSGYGQADPSQPRSAQVAESPARAEAMVTPRTEHSIGSQAPYTKIEQPSPIYHYGTVGPPARPPSGLRGSSGYGHDAGVHGPHEGYQRGQPSYQMTLDTDQGPLVVPVELDLQQASKVADEKRKRNAGASARFRARRKEKEKEASQTISGLQAELRDLIEERDFYLSERNFFRDLAARHIPPSQLPLRPQSPQQRRSIAVTRSSSSEHAQVTDEPYHERSESMSVSQRRRTGDYQPSFIGRQTQSPPVSSYTASFPPAPPISLPPPPPLPTSTYGAPRSLPPGAPLGPSVSRSQSYDPLRRDVYDRGWSSGR